MLEKINQKKLSNLESVSNSQKKIKITKLIFDQNPIIFNTKSSQIIGINNKWYMINRDIFPILLTDDKIYYGRIDEFLLKDDTQISIDVFATAKVIDQLVVVVPALYRLNSASEINFEQIDLDDTVISYGEGVSRHVMNQARKEMDDIFQNKFKDFDKKKCRELGKLIYFCNKEGKQTFSKIHPYFFFLLSKEDDYPILLKRFQD